MMEPADRPRSGRAPDDREPETFETAVKELEAIVERLERGELTLEESLLAFERGTRLLRYCGDTLAAAEERVRVLREREDGALAETDLENGATA
jgi:exodeoxyribonuclease VII small subunit